jgi:IclR family transcriptional regulator, acetate operon repressor
MSSESSSVSVRSVDRAIDLLLALARADEPMGLRELARTVGLPPSTVQRLVASLERRELILKDRSYFRLGPAVVLLTGAFLAGDTLLRAALPALEELTALSGETSTLYLRIGFERVVAQRVNSPHPLRYTLRVGQRLPLHVGAPGLVLLAAMPDNEISQYLERVIPVQLASGKSLSAEELMERLREVRRAGYAISLGERELESASVAAPVVKAGKGTVASVAVTGPASRMTNDKLQALSLEVRRAAQEIARLHAT